MLSTRGATVRHLNTMSQGWLSIQTCSVCGLSEIEAPRKTHLQRTAHRPESLVGRNFDSVNLCHLEILLRCSWPAEKMANISRETYPVKTVSNGRNCTDLEVKNTISHRFCDKCARTTSCAMLCNFKSGLCLLCYLCCNGSCCDVQGRKIKFTNSKTLVGRCRDRPSRALTLTFPNVNNI